MIPGSLDDPMRVCVDVTVVVGSMVETERKVEDVVECDVEGEMESEGEEEDAAELISKVEPGLDDEPLAGTPKAFVVVKVVVAESTVEKTDSIMSLDEVCAVDKVVVVSLAVIDAVVAPIPTLPTALPPLLPDPTA
ncbi:MAG: hypothetical protein M1827_006189 [Pycnora praestabilis]|nr:MAG: hypothetical protein M1827_006189 [Pycnora praestabilis]